MYLVNSLIIFSISNDLTQMVNFPTWIPDSHSPAFLDFFLSSDTGICSALGFPPLGNSDHVVVLVSIDFLSNSQQDARFNCMPYDYSRADWDDLHDHLRYVPWEDIFKLGASAAASEFCEWVQVGIDVYIPHRKYQVKPHSSPWFSAACATAIVYRNHFFVCTKRINLLNPKESSSMLVIVVKGFLKLTNLHMLIKQKNPSLLRNLAVGTFGELQIVFSAKVNLLCLLHLIKENGLLENFLRTQTLIIFISLYLLSLLELI